MKKLYTLVFCTSILILPSCGWCCKKKPCAVEQTQEKNTKVKTKRVSGTHPKEIGWDENDKR